MDNKELEPLITECPHCGELLKEIFLNTVIPHASGKMKAAYCESCRTAYWHGTLDTTKRKAYGVKVE